MAKVYILLSISILLSSATLYTVLSGPGNKAITVKEQQTVIRGGIVYGTYCVLCHGEKADGQGRLANGKIPPPANLSMSMLTDEQKEEIIRKGGYMVGRSPFMPPWGEELSNEQISDLLVYLNAIKAK